ncbi:MAG: heavy metal-binding domain-containing protein [Chitinophagales bacterium]
MSFLVMGLVAFTLTACGGEGSHSHEDGHNHDHKTEEKAKDSHEGHNHDAHEGHNHGSHEGHDHSSHEGHNHGGVDMTSKEYGSTYVCPMHCKDSGSAAAGKCPACGMEYVLNAEHKEDGHTHK